MATGDMTVNGGMVAMGLMLPFRSSVTKKMIILFFYPSSSLKCCRIGCPKIGDLRDDTNSKIVVTAITILVTK